MNNAIITTIKKELRGILRDKKSLMMMLLTPLMIPLFIFMFSFVYDSMMNDDTTDKYQIGINYNMNNVEQDIIKDMDFETKYYSTKEEMQTAFEKGELDAYAIKSNNSYLIYSNEKGQDSYYASISFSSYLDAYNNYLAQNYLSSINADMNRVYNNISYDFEELHGSNDMVNEIITMGFIFAIMAISLTAIYCATDSTAGEKERGTLETFLTFPIKSEELIIGKFLAIFISCLITSLISTILAVVSFGLASNMFEIYKDTILNFNFVTITMGLLIMVAFSVFISGLCIAIASLSKSYKEAQSSLTPVSLLTMIPMFLDILEINMTPILALIPVVNHTMLLKAVFCGTIQNTDLINIIIMFVSTIIYSVIIIKLITKQYKSEKVLFSI